MQGWVCGQAACAFKFFIFLHNLTCPPARGVEPARLFLGPEHWRLGYRDTEKEFYCVVSAGQTFNPSVLLSQHNQEAKKGNAQLAGSPRHKTTLKLMYDTALLDYSQTKTTRGLKHSLWNLKTYINYLIKYLFTLIAERIIFTNIHGLLRQIYQEMITPIWHILVEQI